MLQVILVQDCHGISQARLAAKLARYVNYGAQGMLLWGRHFLVVYVPQARAV